jgi:hypothetical protein
MVALRIIGSLQCDLETSGDSAQVIQDGEVANLETIKQRVGRQACRHVRGQ